jgi:hypothetical protein
MAVMIHCFTIDLTKRQEQEQHGRSSISQHHGLRARRGAQHLGPERDSTGETTGRCYELAAMGLPPFNLDPYHENHMRAHMGDALRTAY